jgi:DNA-binding response OmpR family regulator
VLSARNLQTHRRARVVDGVDGGNNSFYICGLVAVRFYSDSEISQTATRGAIRVVTTIDLLGRDNPISETVAWAQSLVLLAPDASMDLNDLSYHLRSCSFSPIVLPRADKWERLAHLLARWKPLAAVIGGGIDNLASVLRDLEDAGVPVVVVGDASQIFLAGSVGAPEMGIPTPAQGREIAQAVKIIAQRQIEISYSIELGVLRLHLGRRLAWIEGQPVHLPPREFRILAELALHPDEAIAVEELARRVWPEHATVTGDDVRRCIYRLRRMIGDHERRPPLIQNRRGFGYIIRWAGEREK